MLQLMIFELLTLFALVINLNFKIPPSSHQHRWHTHILCHIV
jgi:hypothetical protein